MAVRLLLNMAKVNKSDFKAVQNRNRVNLHRRWKRIVNNESRSINNIENRSFNSNQNQSDNGTISLAEQLRRWALQYNISKRAVSALLAILISIGINYLPRDSRTLLSTPRQIEIINVTNGKFWYIVFSLIKCPFPFSLQIISTKKITIIS